MRQFITQVTFCRRKSFKIKERPLKRSLGSYRTASYKGLQNSVDIISLRYIVFYRYFNEKYDMLTQHCINSRYDENQHCKHLHFELYLCKKERSFIGYSNILS